MQLIEKTKEQSHDFVQRETILLISTIGTLGVVLDRSPVGRRAARLRRQSSRNDRLGLAAHLIRRDALYHRWGIFRRGGPFADGDQLSSASIGIRTGPASVAAVVMGGCALAVEFGVHRRCVQRVTLALIGACSATWA